MVWQVAFDASALLLHSSSRQPVQPSAIPHLFMSVVGSCRKSHVTTGKVLGLPVKTVVALACTFVVPRHARYPAHLPFRWPTDASLRYLLQPTRTYSSTIGYEQYPIHTLPPPLQESVSIHLPRVQPRVPSSPPIRISSPMASPPTVSACLQCTV